MLFRSGGTAGGAPDSEKASAGGLYGGGGAGGTYGNAPQSGGDGASGAVRIIWGIGKSFPSNAS